MKQSLEKTLINYLIYCRHLHKKAESGFTLLELLVVVLIIGILSAIAAPSWEAFTSGQRLRTVNNRVLQAIKTAQTEAKGAREMRRIQFKDNAGIPEITIYNTKSTPKDLADDEVIETQALNLDGAIKPNTLKIYTQASGQTADSISFNYLGVIPDGEEQDKVSTSDPPQVTDGFTVVTYMADNKDARQCVIIQTILGTTRTAEKEDCPEPS